MRHKLLLLLLLSTCLFAGCGGHVIDVGNGTGHQIAGIVMSGQKPIAGAHVYLFAANANGYGNASLSLLDENSTGSVDATGGYISTASDGTFTIPVAFECTPSQELYLYALGGNAGLGDNSAAGELTVLGSCSSLGTLGSSVVMNEATTVAAAFAMAPFSTDAVHVSSSGSPQALIGIANAFANASELVSITTGWSLIVIPSGAATVPRSTVDTLANILSACTYSSGPGSGPCGTLFSSSEGASGAPTDTATAMMNIAHNPATNVSSLFALQSLSPPFTPFLSAAPNDYSIGIAFTGGGMDDAGWMAIDGQGDAWILSEGTTNNFVGSIVEISSSGDFLSGLNGYPVSLAGPGDLAIDPQDNVWIGNDAFYSVGIPTSIVELSNAGALLTGAGGFTGGGMVNVSSIAIDSAGNLWTDNANDNILTEMTESGQFLSGSNGFTGGGIDSGGTISIEPSGNVWVLNNDSLMISEFSASGKPLVGSNVLASMGSVGSDSSAIDAEGNVWVSAIFPSGVVKLVELSSLGAVLSVPNGFSIGTVASLGGNFGVAIDGDGNVWIPLASSPALAPAGSSVPGVVEVSKSGAILSGSNGYQSGSLYYPDRVAIDPSGDVWVDSHSPAPTPLGATARIVELIGIAAPVVTPIAAGVKNNTLGTRP
jgi:hypothetical protein